MYSHLDSRAMPATAVIVFVLSICGCGETVRRAAAAEPDARPTRPVDSSRSVLSLAEIQPPVDTPRRTADEQPPLPPRARQALDRARELRGEERFTEASIELEKALRVAPDDARVREALALNHWLAGNTESVSGHVAAALEVSEDNIVCQYLLGRLAARRFENQEAIRRFRIALLCSTNTTNASFVPLVEFHLAETLAAEGFLSAAIEVYDRLAESMASTRNDDAPNVEFAALQRSSESIDEHAAAVYAQLGRFDRAADRLRSAYPADDMPSALRLTYAEYLRRAERLDEALNQARLAVRTDRSAITLLTEIHEQRGEPHAVIDDLRKLIEESPDDTDLILELAAALDRHGQDEEAVACLRGRLTRRADDLAVSWALFDLLVRAQKWTDAIDVAARAIRAREDHADDVADGIVDRITNDEVAAALLSAAASKAETDFASAFLQGVVASSRGDHAMAVSAFDGALADRPAFVPARVRLGRVHVRQYQWKLAIAAVAPEHVKLAADTRLEKIQADACVGLDRVAEAVEHYQAAIRLNRANTAAMLALAELYADNGQQNLAIRQLEDLVESDPLNERGRELLFRAYLADSDHRAAAEQLTQLRRIAASPTCIARCVAWIEFDPNAPNTEQFRKTLQDAMNAYRPDAETLHLVALSYLQERRPNEAVEVLEQALQIDPAHQASAELLASAYRSSLEFEKALTRRRELLDRFPNRVAWRSEVLELMLAIQQVDEAIELAKIWLAEPTSDDNHRDALREVLLRTYLLVENYDAAIDLLEKIRAEDPDDAFELRRLILVLQTAGKHDRAFALLRDWPDYISGGYAAIDLNAIWSALLPEQHDPALRLMMRAVEEDPDNDSLQIALIQVLTAAGHFDEALQLAKENQVASRNPDAFQEQTFDIYNRAGRVEEAITLINELLLESGRDDRRQPFVPVRLRDVLVRLLIRADRHPVAIRELNRWIEESTSTEERSFYLNLLAICHQDAGNVSEAIQTLTLVLELSPNSVGASNDLGYSLADADQEIERADELIRYAVAAEPRNSAYLDSLGWVRYKQGRFADARMWLTRARYAGEGEDPVVCQHLGDACWRLDDREAAITWWKQAADFARQRAEEPWTLGTDERTLEAINARLKAAEAGDDPPIATTAPKP